MGETPDGAVVDHGLRDSGNRGLDPAQRPSVRHHGNSLAGVRLDDAVDGTQDALAVRFGRLALELDARPLIRGQPFPRAPVLLPQIGIDDDVKAQPSAKDLRRLTGAGKVARIDRVDPVSGKPVGELTRLAAAVVVQRPVGVALQPAGSIPIRLAVANKKQRGHRRIR